eukprot:gb/GECG01010690.1/.p1 GENE.gb/GECG01010690.1/~~gb/GECG01010690.1/.p1  ORF type:complete len:499 (+),score=113.24 gb/GECG01010690.1/:1-1497(+)
MSQRHTKDRSPLRTTDRQRSDRVFLSSSSPIGQGSSGKQPSGSETSPTRRRARDFLQRNGHLIGGDKQQQGASTAATVSSTSYGPPYGSYGHSESAGHLSSTAPGRDLHRLVDPEASGNDESEEPSPDQTYHEGDNDEAPSSYNNEGGDNSAAVHLSNEEWNQRYRVENELLDEFERSQEAEVASLQESVKEAMGELAKVQEGNAELAETLKATQNRKQKAQQDRDAQQADVARLRKRVEAKREKEAEDKREIGSLREEVQGLSVELDDLRRKESSLHKEAKESEAMLQSKVDEVARRTQENENAYSKEIREKEERIKKLNDDMNQTEYQANTASAVAAEAARLKKRLKQENAWKSHKELFQTVKEIMNEQNRLRDILHHVKMSRREEEDMYQKAKYQRDCLYTQLSALVTAAEAASDAEGNKDAVDRVNLDEATAYALSDAHSDDDRGNKNANDVHGDNAEQTSDPSELLERLGGMLEYMDGTLTEELLGNQYRSIQ